MKNLTLNQVKNLWFLHYTNKSILKATSKNVIKPKIIKNNINITKKKDINKDIFLL